MTGLWYQSSADQVTKYQQHPLSAAFPGMAKEDHAELTTDIIKYGLREPISLFEGMILDGWHRHQSCLKTGVAPHFRELPEGVDPVAFVKSHNLLRRHLDGSQRAAAVIKCNDWAEVGSNQYSKVGMEPGSTPQTLASMAKEADVSTRTIQHAKAAEVAGLGDFVRDGKLTAKTAEQISKLPEDLRAEAIANPAILKAVKKSKVKPKTGPETAPGTDRANEEEMLRTIEELKAQVAALEEENRVLSCQVEALQCRVEELTMESDTI